MSEVKYKIRYNVLLLREFTVAELIKATGLNPESIRTELQRMRQEGLLTSTPDPNKPEKRGGQPSIYRISDDPEKRLLLSKSIEAFSVPPVDIDKDEPTSRFYNSAKSLIDSTLNAKSKTSNSVRKKLIKKAQEDLDKAEQAEGGNLISEVNRAYINFERARLAYIDGRFNDAHDILQSIRLLLLSTNKDSSIGRYIDEYELCISACIHFSQGLPNRHSTEEWARSLLETLSETKFKTTSPLVILLVDLLNKLSMTAETELVASVMKVIRDASFVSPIEETSKADYIKLLQQQNIKNQGQPMLIQELISDFPIPEKQRRS